MVRQNTNFKVKFWTKYESNNVKIYTVRYFNKLPYFFNFMKKSFLVLKLCHFKV